MTIQVIYSGGTIGMVDSPHGLVPGADLAGWLERVLAGTALAGQVRLHELAPLIDSSNATPADWQAIIDCVRTPADDAAGFVILHGTDTMTYTSSALSYALADLQVPVVVTGAQLPLGALGSDAAGNVLGALTAAANPANKGVSLFFGQHLLRGNRATKASSWSYEGFASPSAAPLARIGAPWHWDDGALAAYAFRGPQPLATPKPYTRQDVMVASLVPGITAERLEAMLTPAPKAVILRAFGVGNGPSAEPGFTELIARVVKSGTVVVVSSQCHQATVLLGAYETGDVLAQAGAVGTGDMTLEAAYAKLVYGLSQGLTGARLAEFFTRNLAGELDA